MHTDHELVMGRLRRFTRDHLIPAIHRDARPLAATAWQVPGEPVPFAEAIGQAVRAGARRVALGPRLVDDLVPRHR